MYYLKIEDTHFFKPGIKDLALSDVKVELEVNNAGALVFTLPPCHAWYGMLNELTTYIELYNDNSWVWGFRILEIEEDFYKNRVVHCEGWLSFLVDTIMRPFEYTGDILGMLKLIVNTHNSQVEEDKRFTIGKVTVTDNNNYINRSSGNYVNSLEILKTRLVNTHGGYVRIRKENNIKYIDYIANYDSASSQPIRFGENLLDFKKYVKAESVKTAIIPLGAELEEVEGINGVRPKVTIESVNQGKDYLVHDEAVKIWGYIWGIAEYKDVTLPQNLLKKSKEELNELVYSELTLELNAMDLSYMDTNIQQFQLGDTITAISPPHGINKKMLAANITLDLNDPSQNVFILGSSTRTFTSSSNDRNRELETSLEDTANAFKNIIEHQTSLILGGKGGYMYTAVNEAGKPSELYFMDTASIETAVNVLRINKNGIGFSNKGINGPFPTAWTLDGKFNADYITAGKIRALVLEGVTINGGNINVQTDLRVGERIIMQPAALGRTTTIDLNQNTRLISSNSQIELTNEVNGRNARTSIALSDSDAHIYATTAIRFYVSVNNGHLGVLSLYSNAIFAAFPVTVNSDERLKDKIEKIDISELLDEIQVYSFDYKSSAKNQIGVIAQDYEDSKYRSFLLSVDSNGMYGVNYQTINMALVQKVQKQQKEIDTLKEEIQKIKEVLNID